MEMGGLNTTNTTELGISEPETQNSEPGLARQSSSEKSEGNGKPVLHSLVSRGGEGCLRLTPNTKFLN